MISYSSIFVIFDQVSKKDFFKKLEWPHLVKAWSETIDWHQLTPYKVSLRLSGLDGLEYLVITRKKRGQRIFICAKDKYGKLIQSGFWEYDEKNNLCICYRRIYKLEIVKALRKRLPNFLYETFMK
ncbi:hypothetical protein [Bartonella pachyuromydis]|uniref:Phage protein n=1 Tax=Bartonella pachyuromydis TaxID=931097 RepID=A0ABP8VMC4_9HYPH